MAAICCWKEARGEPVAAKIAQICVVRNRVARKWMKDETVQDVVTRKWQFSAMTAVGDANLITWPKAADLSWQDCLNAAEFVLERNGEDITKGAVFYHDISIPGPPPSWGNVVKTAQIGRFKFYKDVKNG